MDRTADDWHAALIITVVVLLVGFVAGYGMQPRCKIVYQEVQQTQTEEVVRPPSTAPSPPRAVQPERVVVNVPVQQAPYPPPPSAPNYVVAWPSIDNGRRRNGGNCWHTTDYCEGLRQTPWPNRKWMRPCTYCVRQGASSSSTSTVSQSTTGPMDVS